MANLRHVALQTKSLEEGAAYLQQLTSLFDDRKDIVQHLKEIASYMEQQAKLLHLVTAASNSTSGEPNES